MKKLNRTFTLSTESQYLPPCILTFQFLSRNNELKMTKKSKHKIKDNFYLQPKWMLKTFIFGDISITKICYLMVTILNFHLYSKANVFQYQEIPRFYRYLKEGIQWWEFFLSPINFSRCTPLKITITNFS